MMTRKGLSKHLFFVRMLTLVCTLPTVSSFVSVPNQVTMTTRQQQKVSAPVALSKQPTTYYNDDAFGLVFLGSAALAQDPVFTGVFLVTSASAAIAASQGKLPSSDNKIPAAVAGLSLLLTPAVSAVIVSLPESPIDPVPGNPSARLIELALCSVSIVYGFVSSSKQPES